MKLFNRGDGTYNKYTEFKYRVGEPVEAYVEDGWRVYEVSEQDDGTVYLKPFGYDLNLQWVYNLEKHKVRQTPDTFKRAKRIYLENIADRERTINHTREREEITEIKQKIKALAPTNTQGRK